MQAVDRDPGRARRARSRPARARTSTCRPPTASSRSCRSPSTSTSPPATSPGPATTSSPAATPVTTLYEAPTAAGCRSPPSSPSSGPTCAALLGLRAVGRRTRLDDAAQDADPRRPARRVQDQDARRVGRRAEPGRHLRRAGADRRPRSSTTSSSLARGAFVDADAPDRRARFRQVGPVLAGQAGSRGRARTEVRDADRRPKPTSVLATRRRPRPTTELDRTLARGREWIGMTDQRRRASCRPRRCEALIGEPQYEEDGRVPGRAGLHLDVVRVGRERQPAVLGRRAVADELTGGPIAPPTMLSVWFRPHHWAPGRPSRAGAAAGPLRPEGALRPARGGHDRQHHHLPRAGAPRRPHHARARSCAR